MTSVELYFNCPFIGTYGNCNYFCLSDIFIWRTCTGQIKFPLQRKDHRIILKKGREKDSWAKGSIGTSWFWALITPSHYACMRAAAAAATKLIRWRGRRLPSSNWCRVGIQYETTRRRQAIHLCTHTLEICCCGFCSDQRLIRDFHSSHMAFGRLAGILRVLSYQFPLRTVWLPTERGGAHDKRGSAVRAGQFSSVCILRSSRSVGGCSVPHRTEIIPRFSDFSIYSQFTRISTASSFIKGQIKSARRLQLYC